MLQPEVSQCSLNGKYKLFVNKTYFFSLFVICYKYMFIYCHKNNNVYRIISNYNIHNWNWRPYHNEINIVSETTEPVVLVH